MKILRKTVIVMMWLAAPFLTRGQSSSTNYQSVDPGSFTFGGYSSGSVSQNFGVNTWYSDAKGASADYQSGGGMPSGFIFQDCELYNMCSEVEGYDATLSWDIVPGATKYKVRIREYDGGSFVDKLVIGNSKDFRIKPGLYEWKLLAEVGGSFIEVGCTKIFKVECSPFNFDMTVVQPDYSGHTGYVRLFNVGNNGEDVQPLFEFELTDGISTLVQSNKKQHKFAGLAAGNYTITITDDFGCTAVDSFQIFELDPTYVPNLIKAQSAAPCGFKVIWNTVNEPGVKRYQASYRNLSLFGPRIIGSTTTDTTFTFSGLEGGNTYSFYVRCIFDTGNGNEFSPWSAPKNRFLDTTGCTPPPPVAFGGSSSGTQVFLTDNLSIFPNPTEGDLNIFSKNGYVSEVSVYASNGKLIFHKRFDEKSAVRIDLSAFPEGLYTLKVLEGDQIFSERIVKR